MLCFVLVWIAVSFAVPASADFEGPDGYGNEWRQAEFEVSHDGYASETQSTETTQPPSYVVIETEPGTTEEIDGETVLVVEEPSPTAATRKAPPTPKTVVAEEQIPPCPSGIWVHGYWHYINGQYLWVDGHCVVERVNYVFVHPRWDFYLGIWWFIPGYYRPCSAWVWYGYHRPWHWFPPYYHPYYRGGHLAPVRRSVPRRPTTATPTPVTPVPSRGLSIGHRSASDPTIVYRTPTGAMRTPRVDRTERAPVVTSPTITSTVPRPRPGSGFVTRPRVHSPRGRIWGRSSSGTSYGVGASSTPSRGFSIGRTPSSPSRSPSPAPSSGSSRGWGGSRSAPSNRGR